MQFALSLPSSRREQFFELAAVKPNTAAIRAGIDNHRPIDRAVNPHQPRRIPRAQAFFFIPLFRRTTAAQRGNLLGIIG